MQLPGARSDIRAKLSLVGLLVGAAGVVFVVRTVANNRDQFVQTVQTASVGPLVLALIVGLAAMSSIGWNWLVMLRRRGEDAPWTRGCSWYFVGQLGKYVPGGVWPVVGRAELAVRGGVDREGAYSTTGLSMFTTYVAASVVAGFAGLSQEGSRRVLAACLLAGGAGVVLLAGQPAIQQWVRSRIVRASGRSIRLPGYRRLVIDTSRHVPAWLLMTASTALVVAAFGGDVDLVELAFVNSLAWLVGFLVIGVPGGIGVREAVFIALMSNSLGEPLATSVALGSRAVYIVVDLLGAAVVAPAAHLAGMRSSGES